MTNGIQRTRCEHISWNKVPQDKVQWQAPGWPFYNREFLHHGNNLSTSHRWFCTRELQAYRKSFSNLTIWMFSAVCPESELSPDTPCFLFVLDILINCCCTWPAIPCWSCRLANRSPSCEKLVACCSTLCNKNNQLFRSMKRIKTVRVKQSLLTMKVNFSFIHVILDFHMVLQFTLLHEWLARQFCFVQLYVQWPRMKNNFHSRQHKSNKQLLQKKLRKSNQ